MAVFRAKEGSTETSPLLSGVGTVLWPTQAKKAGKWYRGDRQSGRWLHGEVAQGREGNELVAACKRGRY